MHKTPFAQIVCRMQVTTGSSPVQMYSVAVTWSPKEKESHTQLWCLKPASSSFPDTWTEQKPSSCLVKVTRHLACHPADMHGSLFPGGLVARCCALPLELSLWAIRYMLFPGCRVVVYLNRKPLLSRRNSLNRPSTNSVALVQRTVAPPPPRYCSLDCGNSPLLSSLDYSPPRGNDNCYSLYKLPSLHGTRKLLAVVRLICTQQLLVGFWQWSQGRPEIGMSIVTAASGRRHKRAAFRFKLLVGFETAAWSGPAKCQAKCKYTSNSGHMYL